MDRLIGNFRLLLLAWLHRSRSGQISFERCFSYRDIKRATDSFHTIIYRNSRGTAYKATFQDGEVALVKEIQALNLEKDAFYREVQPLGRLHHRTFLHFEGFLQDVRVFDGIENGSLKEHLNDPLKTSLDWKTRLQIAIGVAAALEYLLFFSNLSMYHFSISTSSIMLDENFTAKLSDVGLLSSIGNYDALSSAGNYAIVSHASCSKECTSPEQNIIFQLGVLILELVTGQSSDQGGADLIQRILESCFSSSNDRSRPWR